MSTNERRDANAAALVDIFQRQAGTADPSRRSSAATHTRRKLATRTARLTAAIDTECLRMLGFKIVQNVDDFTWEGEPPVNSWVQAGDMRLKSFETDRELLDEGGNVVGYEVTAKFQTVHRGPPVPSVDRDERLPLLQQLVEQQAAR